MRHSALVPGFISIIIAMCIVDGIRAEYSFGDYICTDTMECLSGFGTCSEICYTDGCPSSYPEPVFSSSSGCCLLSYYQCNRCCREPPRPTPRPTPTPTQPRSTPTPTLRPTPTPTPGPTLHEDDEELVHLGEYSATAITVVASTAIASSAGGAVGSAVGGGGASAGGLNVAGDILSVIAQVQFVALVGTMSLPLKEGIRLMGADLAWLNFQVRVPRMPKFGRRHRVHSAAKGLESYLAAAGMSAEEMFVSSMFSAVAFGVALVVAHIFGARWLVKYQRRKNPAFTLPKMLCFPVPEVAAFWLYFTGGLQSSLVALSFDSTHGACKFAAVVVLVVMLSIMVGLFALVLDPLSQGLVPAKVRDSVYGTSAAVMHKIDQERPRSRTHSSEKPSSPPGLQFRADAQLVSSKARWLKTVADPQHVLGAWEVAAREEEDEEETYETWLLDTFALVFGRLTNAISFFCFDVFVNKVLLVLVFVGLSGTDGVAQTLVALCASILQFLVVFTVLPFNSMLSNVRELINAGSHVLIFIVPLVALVPNSPLSWHLTTKIMLVTNLVATMASLALQLAATAATIRAVVKEQYLTTTAALAAAPIIGTSPVVPPTVLKAVVESVAGAVIDVLVEKLIEPFDTYQATFRTTWADLKLEETTEKKSSGSLAGTAHRTALEAVRALFADGSGAVAADVRDEAEAAAAAAVLGAILEAIKAALAPVVVDELTSNPPPELAAVLAAIPHDALEAATTLVVGVGVDMIFKRALDALSIDVDVESETELPTLDLEKMAPSTAAVLEEIEEDEEDGEDAEEAAEADEAEKMVLVHDPIMARLKILSRRSAAEVPVAKATFQDKDDSSFEEPDAAEALVLQMTDDDDDDDDDDDSRRQAAAGPLDARRDLEAPTDAYEIELPDKVHELE